MDTTKSSECLTDDLLLRLVEGHLEQMERRAMLAHVDGCPTCRRLLAGAVETADGSGPPGAEDRPVEPVRGASVGRFVVIDRIGVGATAEVHVAYDPKLDRKVALKLLRPSPGKSVVSAGLEERLVREAQALARLSHPNVVPVFDVGRHGDRVFVAMEYVAGTTLRAWLVQPRPWRELLAMFLQVGRGLAAAHAVGIVHRDFKPENVLVGTDQRPRVADFGLARAASEISSSGAGAFSVLSSADMAATLTRTGSVLGTPAYMAPEQLRGDKATSASDQFSYCVALYEALNGARPFGGSTPTDLLRSIDAQRPRAPVRDGGAPRRVQAAVLRGLVATPADRFPSMDALLAALSPRPVTRRGLVATVLAVALAVGGASVLFVDHAAIAGPRCERAGERLAGAWDQARKHQLREAFRRTGATGADATWQSFSAILDQRAAAWTAMQVEACAATHEAGVQSPAILDLRTACMERKRQEMKNLVDVYADALSPEILDRAVAAADKLSSVAACADVENLLAVVPLPEDPATRVKVESLRQRLSHGRALYDAGKFERGRDYLEALKRESDTVAYPPLSAEVAHALAGHLDSADNHEEAEKMLLEAARQAVRGGDRRLEADIWVTLVNHYGGWGRIQEGLVVATMAELAVERASGDDLMRARLENNVGNVESAAGHVEKALLRYQRAEKLWRGGEMSPRFATILVNVGDTLVLLSRTREALGYFERARAIQKAILRPDHPDIARTLTNIGNAQLNLGRFHEATQACRDALAIYKRELGIEHTRAHLTRLCLGHAEAYLGNYDRAFEMFESVLSIQQRDLKDIYVSTTYLLLAEAQKLAGRWDEAEATVRRVLEHNARVGANEHMNSGQALMLLGSVHNGRRQYRRGLRECRHALDILSRELGADSVSLLETRECIADALNELGDFDGARQQLEPALAASSPADMGPRWTAGVRFQLSRALWSRPAERARARELARTTLHDLVAAEGDNRALMRRIEVWLARTARPAHP